MKFAYLIMAHNNKYILYKLLKLLDDSRNDIYLHIDIKASEFNEDEIQKQCRFANVIFVDRTNVAWGGYSQINCELLLLKNSIKRKYDYYHILSGVDLPLKSQDYIYDFFSKNYGKEFVGFFPNWTKRIDIKRRYSKFHFGQDKAGRNKKSIWFYLIKFNRKIQIYLLPFIDRSKKQQIQFQGGPNWISITDEFARYIVSKENWIKSTFLNTLCCDEIFVQTLMYNSPFYEKRYIRNEKDNAFESCMRYIDWERGEPYTWKAEDFRELMDSPYLFARKFGIGTTEEKQVVDKIFDTLNTQEK